MTSEVSPNSEEAASARRPLTAEEVHNGLKQQRSVNALHEALSHGDLEEVKRLIEVGDDLLITQQSPSGCTPLMLLAMGHWDEGLILQLLARRAAVESSATLRSERRRTAADYALESLTPRSPELVATLRALELEERKKTARFRCPECGDVVRRRPLLRFFWERAAKGAEEDNALLRDFFRRDEHRVLLEPWYHQVNEMRGIRKELSESLALLRALRVSLASANSAAKSAAKLSTDAEDANAAVPAAATVADLEVPILGLTAAATSTSSSKEGNQEADHEPEATEEKEEHREEESESSLAFLSSYHVVDLCCGKSLTGCLAALRCPGLAVTAVDRLEPGFMPHFAVGSPAQTAVAAASHGAAKEGEGRAAQTAVPSPVAKEGDGGPSGRAAASSSCSAAPCCDPGRMYTYHDWDVMGDAFVDQLRTRIEEVGRPTVLLGMHLCGALSLRAIEAFAALPMVAALALAPCCLPGRSEPETVAPRSLFESKQSTAQYQAWCTFLEGRLSQAEPAAQVTSSYVQEVLSPKNFVLCGVRSVGQR